VPGQTASRSFLGMPVRIPKPAWNFDPYPSISFQ
jgi:hypothetical protein